MFSITTVTSYIYHRIPILSTFSLIETDLSFTQRHNVLFLRALHVRFVVYSFCFVGGMVKAWYYPIENPIIVWQVTFLETGMFISSSLVRV